MASQWPTLDYESALWQAGAAQIAGLDEAGRGAWAGPVVAGAAILPADLSIAQRLQGVADSKQLTPARREALFDTVTHHALAWAVGEASAEEIDSAGIVPATRLAMQRALECLPVQPDYLLIDHLRLPLLAISQQSITRGDSLVLSIAVASILAKVHRDRLLVAADAQYPGFGFARHKGYGVEEHRLALERLGPCPIHRFSFQPIRGRQMALFPGSQPVEQP